MSELVALEQQLLLGPDRERLGREVADDRLVGVAAAEAYLRISKDKDTVADILAMLNDPAIVYTTTPQNVMKYVDFMNSVWYRRVVAVPKAWHGRNVLLHFQAVDYEATVWVNGKEVLKAEGDRAAAPDQA